MLTTAVALAVTLGSGLAWGGLDALRKLLARHASPVAVVIVVMGGMTPMFALWMALSGPHRLEADYLVPGLAALAVNVLANLLFIRALAISELSLTVPILALSPVFAALIGMPLLGEFPGALRWLGIVIVVVGALVLHLPAADGARAWRRLGAIARDRGAVMMIAVALGWAASTALDKAAIRVTSAPVHGILQAGGVALVLLALLAARGRLGTLRPLGQHWRLTLSAALFSTAAFGLQLVAVQFLLVSLFEAAKRVIGQVSAVLVGRVLFGERITWPKLAGIAVMSVGIVLVLAPI